MFSDRLLGTTGYAVTLLSVGEIAFDSGAVVPDRPVSTTVNVLLLRGHGQTLLVDAGSGPADVLWPGAAGLDEALESAGVERDEIDALVLTHLDFDHAGGALAGQWPDRCTPAFPHAIVSAVDLGVPRPGEPDHWDVAARVVVGYDASGRLELAGDGDEFRPGLRLVSAPGHRPGHCVLLVGDELVYGADLLHHEEHVAHPEWDARFDAEPELALATRRLWLRRLRQTGTPAAFAHVPTFGRVVAGPRWLPLPEG